MQFIGASMHVHRHMAGRHVAYATAQTTIRHEHLKHLDYLAHVHIHAFTHKIQTQCHYRTQTQFQSNTSIPNHFFTHKQSNTVYQASANNTSHSIKDEQIRDENHPTALPSTVTVG